jgi:hypothetical protein
MKMQEMHKLRVEKAEVRTLSRSWTRWKDMVKWLYNNSKKLRVFGLDSVNYDHGYGVLSLAQ